MKIKIFLLILVFAFFGFSCGKPSNRARKSENKPLILVSLPPYQHLVEQIAGGLCEVQTIVPVGADPHTYEPNAKQATKIARAQIWFRIGEPFEKKLLSAIQEQNPSLQEVDLRKGIPLLHGHSCQHHHHDDSDRHFWLSPKTTILQIPIITNALVQKFPEQETTFLKNAQMRIEEFHQIDETIASLLEPLKHRAFLVSHPAFAYFCHDYSLHQLSIEYEGKEPTSRHLQETIENASAENVKIALLLPQHPAKGLLAVANKLHLTVHTIDPYAPNSLETMRLLAEWMKDSESQ